MTAMYGSNFVPSETTAFTSVQYGAVQEEVAVNRTVCFYQDQQHLSVAKRPAIASNTKGSSKEKAHVGKGPMDFQFLSVF